VPAYARKNFGYWSGQLTVSSYQQDLTDGGLDIIRLQNDRVDVAIVPAAGGKIIELIDRRSGRNWLWRNPHIPLALTRRGADFDSEQDSGGWDEILLSVKPGRIRSASKEFGAIPDHGDLIDSKWAVDNLEVTSAGDVVCDMTAVGTSAPYCFKRQLRLHDNEAVIDLDYTLANTGDEPLPAYWCAHPLIAIEPGATIDIDGSPLVRVDDAAMRQLTARGSEHCWPVLKLSDGKSLNLSEAFNSGGAQSLIASKIFVRSPATGAASIRLGDDERLTFKFDPSELPWLGLWINNRGWSGCGSEPYTNLGFEPATCPYDCVNEAIENEAVPWLEAGSERRWGLRLELQS